MGQEAPGVRPHTGRALGSTVALDGAGPARRLAAGALHERVNDVVIVVKALVLAGVPRDEAGLDLVRPWFLAVAAADEPIKIGGVQVLHPGPCVALQLPYVRMHVLQLGAEAR